MNHPPPFVAARWGGRAENVRAGGGAVENVRAGAEGDEWKTSGLGRSRDEPATGCRPKRREEEIGASSLQSKRRNTAAKCMV